MNQIPSLLFDNKLLYIFVEIYRQKSVSDAAIALDMTQPAVSLGLRRLREHYDNPLFTRVGNEMQGTTLAHELYPMFEEIIDSLQSLYKFTEHFDPLTSTTMFSLVVSDIGDMVLLPNLLKISQQVAPSIRYDMSSSYANLKERMQEGEVDLAVGFFPDLEAGFYHKRLISQVYMGIVRADHPRLSSIKSDSMVYFDEKHIDVNNSSGEGSLIERELKSLSYNRQMILRLSNYLGLSKVISSSDLVATVPEILAQQLCENRDLQMFTLPFECHTYPIYAYWHEKRHKDVDHIWLRELLFNAADQTVEQSNEFKKRYQSAH